MRKVIIPFLLTVALIAWHSQFATANAPGDANGDGRVDIQDLLLVTSAFNASPPSDTRADTNGDAVVDIFDLVSVGSRFGWVQPNLARYPYIQSTTTATTIVAWRTDIPVDSRVDYGTAAGYGLSVTDSTRTTDHALTLAGLLSDTTYHYRVSGSGVPLAPDETFKTAPGPSGSQFSFVAFGDSGDGSPNMTSIANLVKTLNPDFLVHTGDLIYDAGEPRNFDPRFFTPYKDVIKSKPFFPTMGNHDTYTAAGQPWLDAFYLPSNNPSGTERYYSFDYGNAHFVSLYVPEDVAVPQEQQSWLINDLRSTTLTWKFVFFHVPPYSSSAHGNALAVRNSISNLLEGYGVDIVFNGHDHDYERTTTLKDYSPDLRGVYYVVTGGGGASLYPAGASPFTAFSASVFHVTQVQVNGNVLTLRAIRADGTVIDTLTVDRNPAP